MNPSSRRPSRLRADLALATALATALALAPLSALTADKDQREDRAEMRVKDLHSRLKILPAQEAQWTEVATIMRDNAVIMDKLTQTRIDHAKGVTAVEDLKSYSDISDAHADGIRKLVPAFSALYTAMSDSQKKQADLLFREGDRAHGGNEASDKTPVAK